MGYSINTGFCVPVLVSISSDKGKGVFVTVDVSKGTMIWKPNAGSYKIYDEQSLKLFFGTLTQRDVIYELEHMYGTPEFPDYVIRIVDGGEMINHSSTPNMCVKNQLMPNDAMFNSVHSVQSVALGLLDDRFSLIAIQDIQCGEEITLDYDVGIEDPPYYDALCEQYQVDWSWKD